MPKKSLEFGFSSHIINLHVGDNFSESEYGLETNYGDYKYFYDYFGDGDFGVINKIPLNPIRKEKINGAIKSERNVDRFNEFWKSFRGRNGSNNSSVFSERNLISIDGLGNESMGENQNNKSEENNQEGDISPEEDTYFKTGADGTNRPRYEKRFSLKKSLREQYHDQLADAAKRIAEKQAKVLSDSKKGIKARAADYLDRAEYNWADRRFYLRFYNGQNLAHRQA